MSKETQHCLHILIAEDDPDDRLLMEEAVEEASAEVQIHCVQDGIELLEYLRRRITGGEEESVVLPDLILLDLNMPRMDGREALEQIKDDDELRQLPVFILTTSRSPEDRNRAKILGAAGFLTKPSTFDGLVNLLGLLSGYLREHQTDGTKPGLTNVFVERNS